MDQMKKKYGLILKNKETTEKVLKKTAVFGDDDEEDDRNIPVTSTNMSSASVIRIQKAAEREHQKAQAEDPSIFDYDSNYDEIQSIKNEKKEESRKADKNRESKYAENIIKAHARRQLEQFSREERQQAKERVQEGDEFADKEVFVTGAYRKQQEDVKKYREEEAEEARFNDMTSVQKQKLWQVGFGQTLLNDISRDPTVIMKRKKEQKNTRARLDSSPSPTREKPTEEIKKKSIYSDDEEEEKVEDKPPKKNFEGDLKPGLNTVTKKAKTRAEQVRGNFTPTPSSSEAENSDDEDERRGRRGRSKSDSRERRGKSNKKEEEENVDIKHEVVKPKMSLKEKLKPKKIDKEARLAGLKEILKQRNTPEQIEEMRQRYFERRDSGLVVPPL
ncbi:unnamed protein product [Caenorhabditis angaria]|uniref:Nuclear speckle splicing regulatory protein 1 N-terminal domain-containing protein n=1 Tax=Caenorhabditis angaria TaxID=860376 RepID=A0A9P1IJ21_9PELO|nr:unnamed protein product [Caenorhabditis angaria]